MGAGGYKKRSARIAIRREAVLTEADGCEVDVLIVDVSKDGFRLQSPAELTAGDDVLLQVGKSAPVRARIQWTRGDEAGGAFLEPVDL